MVTDAAAVQTEADNNSEAWGGGGQQELRDLLVSRDHLNTVGTAGAGQESRTNREDVKREPLTPPKVERATAMGMIHDITPSSFSPKV